ncbi:lactate racemase domain-containing protein, partial [Gemmatimonadota bacterium]
MQLRLAYGKEGLEIGLPDDLRARVLEPEFIEGLPDQAGALRAALRQPIGCPPLKSLIGPEDTIGIVFSDVTRPAPNRLLVSAILDELGSLSRDRIMLFNATGTHRPNTASELKELLGEKIAANYKIVQNDANDRDSHVPAGTTADGNEILLLREYLDCTVKILTGFIEPHFFAGFSGGGKACMPGLASLDTICRNHSVKNLDSPLTTWGVTEGNPVWEDVRQAVSLAPPAFLVNVALNRNKQ